VWLGFGRSLTRLPGLFLLSRAASGRSGRFSRCVAPAGLVAVVTELGGFPASRLEGPGRNGKVLLRAAPFQLPLPVQCQAGASCSLISAVFNFLLLMVVAGATDAT
jgi:hypothetical protein